jgi:hypothetical protein
MKIKALFLGALLAAMAAAPVWADGTPAWMRDNQLTIGFAVGKGFVDRSDSEIAAFQYRVEFRRNWIYVACRGSWVAQNCNSRPNPTESSFLAGASVPLGTGRSRINIGIGVGKTSLYRALRGLPCEVRLKHGVLGLTVFSNFNRAHSFHGICVSFDFPLRIFNK